MGSYVSRLYFTKCDYCKTRVDTLCIVGKWAHAEAPAARIHACLKCKGVISRIEDTKKDAIQGYKREETVAAAGIHGPASGQLLIVRRKLATMWLTIEQQALKECR